MSEVQANTAELVPIREHGGKQAVSGRELHEFLELGRDYTTWFKKMVEYGFAEGVDYLPISGEVAREGRGTVARTDHALTLDMAKHIGMVQRTERGRQIRDYFIEVEKRARQTPVELDRRALALMVIEAEDARVAAEQRAVEAEQFQEHIELNDGLTVRDFHKKYFSEHGEREVNEFFYDRGLLLDERGKRWDERTQRPKDGKNHRRPTYTGKPFFYLHSKLDRDKVRREETRVRPGAPELALVEYMTKRGFTANRSESKELAA
ncbi:antA/AntB antirepressor family protein [Leucobacter sp. NPDC015123]|uniref:antA/AntB antirepressor family protein n=1 Tax=Leucobacter sp. NPDC015123 TaxID=3364129 RepID=UPI0036F450F7